MINMNMVVFDTLKLSQKLEGAGFTREQATGAAEALSDTFTDSVAAKGDLREMESRIDVKLEAIKGDLRAVRGEMREMEGRIDGKFEAVKGEMRLIRWMLALVIAATVIPLVRDLL